MSRIMTLPKIGVNMTEAVVDEWFVKPGDIVKQGDAIFLAETDKATQDIFATDSGIVGKLLAEQGDKVEINEPVLLLLDEGEELGADTPASKADDSPPVEKVQSEAPKTLIAKAQTPAPIPNTQNARIKISPLARKTAKELGIDIAELSPSEPGKRIVKADVLNQNESAPTAFAQKGTASASGNVPDTITVTANADNIVSLCQKLNESGTAARNVDIITKAAAVAIRKHGAITGFAEQINIAVETETPRGASSSVIFGADSKSVSQINNDIDQAAPASGGVSFAITDLSALGIENHVPGKSNFDCATLSIGTVTKSFVPDENGNPVSANQLKLTLAFDAGAVERAAAAKFVKEVQALVENPMMMLAL